MTPEPLLIEPPYAREYWAMIVTIRAESLRLDAKHLLLDSQLESDSYRGPARDAAIAALGAAAQELELHAARILERNPEPVE